MYIHKEESCKIMKKIFQIGFNKVGTVSLHEFFLKNGISSVHWDRGNLSKTIHSNKLSGKPLCQRYGSGCAKKA